jgi:hypothetical protein
MDNKIWGPYFWFTLHTITLSYPDKPSYENKRHFNDFFINLQHVIPCNKCQQHYRNHITNNPISTALDSKEHLVVWLFNLHNIVNESLGKKKMEFPDFQEKYRKIYSPTIPEKIVSTVPMDNWFKLKLGLFIIFFLGSIGGIYWYYRRNRINRRLFFQN